MHVDKLGFCGALPGLEFVVPDHVVAEVEDPRQRTILADAISRGVLREVSITDLAALTLFAELTQWIGRGEAACLALCAGTDWLVASDEKRRFRREADVRLGPDRVIGTEDLYRFAIRAQLLSVEEADQDKATLESHRFRLPFASFRDFP
jgi:predicted nucleic acid-binding protein